MNRPKKDPWRIVVAAIAVAFIVYMWVKKDVSSVYGTLPKDQMLPVIFTNVAVTAVKILVISGAVLFGKWIAEKYKGKRK